MKEHIHRNPHKDTHTSAMNHRHFVPPNLETLSPDWSGQVSTKTSTIQWPISGRGPGSSVQKSRLIRLIQSGNCFSSILSPSTVRSGRSLYLYIVRATLSSGPPPSYLSSALWPLSTFLFQTRRSFPERFLRSKINRWIPWRWLDIHRVKFIVPDALRRRT